MRTCSLLLFFVLAVPDWARAQEDNQEDNQEDKQEDNQQDEEVREAYQPCIEARCDVEPVELVRAGPGGRRLSLRLVDCSGRPDPQALALLGELAQAQGGSAEGAVPAALDEQLLLRLQAIAEHYPGRAIELVSGHRPDAQPGSRHRSGHALDLRVEGVDNRELSELARTLPRTGVGYYPNSTHVHIDVRESGAYWVDQSGPGQAPDYAATAPAAHAIEPGAGMAEAAEAPAAGVAEAAAIQQPGPATAPDDDTSAAALPAHALDDELAWLSDRALIVMNRALGRQPGPQESLPERAE